MKSFIAAFLIWTFSTIASFAILGSMDGALSSPNFVFSALLAWILWAILGLVLILFSTVHAYRRFHAGFPREGTLCILLLILIPTILYFSPRIYGPMAARAEVRDFRKLGTTELRHEVYQLIQDRLVSNETIILETEDLPPLLKTLSGNKRGRLSNEGFSITTDGLGSRRSGLLVRPLPLDQAASAPMEGIEKWSG